MRNLFLISQALSPRFSSMLVRLSRAIATRMRSATVTQSRAVVIMDTQRVTIRDIFSGDYSDIRIRVGGFTYEVKPVYQAQDSFMILCCAVNEFGEWHELITAMVALIQHPSFRLKMWYLKRAMRSGFFAAVPMLIQRGAPVTGEVLAFFNYCKEANDALIELVRAGLPVDAIGHLVDDEEFADLSQTERDKQLLLRKLKNMTHNPVSLYRTSLAAVRHLPQQSWSCLPTSIRRGVEKSPC